MLNYVKLLSLLGLENNFFFYLFQQTEAFITSEYHDDQNV